MCTAPPAPPEVDLPSVIALEGFDFILKYQRPTTPVKIGELYFEWRKQQVNGEFTLVMLGGRLSKTSLQKFLNISSVQKSDEGLYQVNISNEFGASIQTIPVLVEPQSDTCAIPSKLIIFTLYTAGPYINCMSVHCMLQSSTCMCLIHFA